MLVIFTTCCVAVRADVWKNHKSLNRATATGKTWNYTGKSWNYTGTRLNGITHGGGALAPDPYQRTKYKGDNDMMSGKMEYGRTAVNAMNVQDRKTGSYDVSFNGEPTRKSNYHIVSGKAFHGSARRYGGGFGIGAPTERTYRYGRRNVNYGVPASSAVIVDVKHSAAKGVNGNVVMDGDRMNSAARDDFGNPKGPKAAPYGELGTQMFYDRNGGLGPAAKPVFDTPLDDSLLILLLLAGVMAILKKKK